MPGRFFCAQVLTKSKAMLEGIGFREIKLDSSNVNKKEKVVAASLSSTEAAERYYGTEILSHDIDAVDLSRAVDGGIPLLFSHNPNDVIGVVENVHLSGERVKANLRFGNSARAKEVWEDVSDGILKNVSIGYVIHEMQETDDFEFTATKWELLEASVVAIPADKTVGVGRSYKHKKIKGKKIMSQEKLSRSERKNQKNSLKGIEEMRANEVDRQTEINALASMHGNIKNIREMAEDAIRSGMDEGEFGRLILDNMPSPTALDLTPSSDIGGYSGSGRNFSLTKAIKGLVDPKAQREAGFEMEVSNDLATRMGRETGGIFVPIGELSTREVSKGGTGGNLVATELDSGNFIDILRAKSAIMRRATLLPGLIGDVDIPQKLTGSTAFWIGGDGQDSITESTPTFSKKSLSPKTVGSLVSVSHKMMNQSSLNIDDILMRDIAETLSLEIDIKSIAGDGTGNTPLGIINTTGVSTQTVAATGAPTLAEIIGFETAVLNANVGEGSMAYLTTPTVAGSMKSTVKDSGSGQFLWENGLVNGRAAEATNIVPANGMIFGSFEHLFMGTWGVMEILADPYGVNFAKGSVSLRVLFDIDIALRHPGAFCINA